MSEQRIQQAIRIALSEGGCRVFRNNCGAYKDAEGRFVRYGVASPGGSDLIGWKSVTVTHDMLGQRLAVFVAVEVKGPKTPVRPEQTNFIERVIEAGGFAGVARSTQEALAIANAI